MAIASWQEPARSFKAQQRHRIFVGNALRDVQGKITQNAAGPAHETVEHGWVKELTITHNFYKIVFAWNGLAYDGCGAGRA